MLEVLARDSALGHDGSGVARSSVGEEVGGLSLPHPSSCRDGGVLGGGGDGPPVAGNEGDAYHHRRRRAQAAGEEEQGGGVYAKEVAALPPPFCSSTQPHLLRGGGVGVSPTGNRFWLLAGNDSDEEAEDSSVNPLCRRY